MRVIGVPARAEFVEARAEGGRAESAALCFTARPFRYCN